jgi:hypothetical protein
MRKTWKHKSEHMRSDMCNKCIKHFESREIQNMRGTFGKYNKNVENHWKSGKYIKYAEHMRNIREIQKNMRKSGTDNMRKIMKMWEICADALENAQTARTTPELKHKSTTFF